MTLVIPTVSDPETQRALDVVARAFPVAVASSSVNGMVTSAFNAYRNAAVSLTTGAVVVFDGEQWDYNGWYDAATGRFTPKLPGLYRLSWSVRSDAGLVADKFWVTTMRKNGAAETVGQIVFQRGTLALNSVGTQQVQANGISDFFDVIVEHDVGVGVAQALRVGKNNTYFAGELIGRL